MVRRWPLWLACAFAALEFALFGLNVRSAVVPDVLVSVPALVLFALSVSTYWQAWHGVAEPTARRFWRMIAIAATLVVAGQLVDARSLLNGPNPPVGPHQLATAGLPLLLILAALYRLPFGGRSRGERQRLLLDLLTVALAVALFVWYFAKPSPAGTGFVREATVSGALMVIISLMVFGLLKAIMSGAPGIDPPVLRLFSAGLVVEILGIFVAPLVATRPHYSVEVLTRALGQVLLIASAGEAVPAVRAGADRPDRARRPFTFLPYAAVASVHGLLLATLGGHHGHRVVVGVTAVVVTGLVVARQIGAFRGNARLLDELRRQERRFRSLVQNATDVIAICDRDGTITYVSPGVHQLIGLTPDQLVGTTGVPVHPDDQAVAAAAFAAVLAEPGRTERYEFRAQHADGGWRRVRITITNLLDDPAVGGIVTNSSDITATHEYHSQLSHQASHDALTDLANRSLFGAEVARALAARDGRPVSLALVDLDDFKAVNDTLGHHAGDALLIAVAERLRRGVRPNDLVARLGGDEFAVLLDGAAGASVETVADRMLGILTEPLTIDGHTLCVQASVGIAEAGPDDSADLLMRHADLALYEAKGAGKGRYVRYAEHMKAKLSLRAESAAELHRALGAGEFELHYQPIVTLPAGRLTGVEALLRWRHPERGLVSPAEFIPLAERTGMIVPIGRWVMAQACRDMAAWRRDFPETAPKTINVNVAPRQLAEPTFVDDVVLALAATELPAELLVIELVESAIAGDVAEQLCRLRDLGVRIALDDFGTGQSTLSLLDICPVDELKLDRSFVRDPAQDKVATVVATMARVLGVEVVAEGIETPQQAEHLHRLGYGLAQGFHFARPVPAATIAESLRRELVAA